MTHHDIREFAAGIIREELLSAGISINRIVLFGSQSRGDAGPDSDWDFLVCINRELSFSEKAIIITQIQTRLAERLISADVVLKSEARLKQERGNVGFITYYALKDGVPV